MATPTKCSIRTTKSIPRRGTVATFSNRYFFDGPAVLTEPEFEVLADLLVAAEKHIYATNVSFEQAIGYNGGSDVSVISKSIADVTPDFDNSGLYHSTSDSCGLASFETDARSSKNHPIYLFKYWHGVHTVGGSEGDALAPTQRAVMVTFSAALQTGFNDGTQVRHLCGPSGAVAQSHAVDEWVRHRDFPA